MVKVTKNTEVNNFSSTKSTEVKKGSFINRLLMPNSKGAKREGEKDL